MSTVDLHEALSLARALVRKAATLALALRGSVTVTRKPDDTPLTEADLRIQRLFLDTLGNRYPGHAFIGEERQDDTHDGPSPGETEYCWVVDPLDGTRNFAQGFPLWCTSVALMRYGQPVLGLVHEHNSGWECSAVIGEGTRCNRERVQVAKRPIDGDILIATPSGRRQSILPVIEKWIDRYVLRNVGSTAMHMAYLATGAVDAVYCNECKIWDVAAGTLLITESGGRCGDFQGEKLLRRNLAEYGHHDLPFFAATPVVYEALFADIPAGTTL